jgi:predicted HTH transcriptional regulator
MFDIDDVGQYISALSNSAAILVKPNAYMIWGIDNKSHNITGTVVNYNADNNGEPIQHYLARKISPSIPFFFDEAIVGGKKIVDFTIPAAKIVPTDFDGIRYIRIGSSKENLKKYPQREAFLFSDLTFGLPTITNKESEYQDLSFNQLFTYYASKRITLNKNNFITNLHLITKDGKYNIMAQLLSDNSYVPIRVAIFDGKTNASKMYSVKEFGYKCLLYSLYEVLNFGEIFNSPQAKEDNRIMEHEEVMLFDYDVYREAVKNAFLHNKWVDLNQPMITI